MSFESASAPTTVVPMATEPQPAPQAEQPPADAPATEAVEYVEPYVPPTPPISTVYYVGKGAGLTGPAEPQPAASADQS
jgi:hypothetical protein